MAINGHRSDAPKTMSTFFVLENLVNVEDFEGMQTHAQMGLDACPCCFLIHSVNFGKHSEKNV